LKVGPTIFVKSFFVPFMPFCGDEIIEAWTIFFGGAFADGDLARFSHYLWGDRDCDAASDDYCGVEVAAQQG
jgi:hypothetical protein